MSTNEFDNVLALQKKAKRQEQLRNDIPLYLMMLTGILYLIANN